MCRTILLLLLFVILLLLPLCEAEVVTGTGFVSVDKTTGTDANVIAATVPMKAKGSSGQTVDQFVVENSADADKFTVSKEGNVEAASSWTTGGDIGGAALSTSSMTVTNNIHGADINTGTATITGTAAATVPFTAKAHATQTGNMLEAKNVGGTNLLYVSIAGKLTTTGSVDVNDLTASGGATIDAATDAAYYTAHALTFTNTAAATSPLVIQAAAGQTANLLVLENSAGVDKFYVSSGGNVYSASSITASSFSGSIVFSDIDVSGTSNSRSTYGITDMGSSAQGALADACAQAADLTYTALGGKSGNDFTANGWDITDLGPAIGNTYANWLNTYCETDKVTNSEVGAIATTNRRQLQNQFKNALPANWANQNNRV